MKPDYPILEFADALKWRKWLDARHADTQGVWLRFYKKASGVTAVTYDQALDHALCYGWIDGQTKKYDELSYLQKFTPRRSRSMWSKRNIAHIARLRRAKLLMPAGLAEVKRAQADGRWEAAYDSSSEMVLPEDFLDAVRSNKKTAAFFETLGRTHRFMIGLRLQTAKKPETRARRMQRILESLKKGEKPA